MLRTVNDEVSEKLRDLDSNGFCIISRAITSEACDAVVKQFKDWYESDKASNDARRGPDNKLPRIINLHLALPLLAKLFTASPLVLAIQDAFFKAEAVLYTSLFYEQGSAQAFHRDAPYFATRPSPESFLGVWFALESIDADNGPLAVYPGGHKVDGVDQYAIARRHFANLADVPPIDGDLWNDYQSSVVARCEAMNLQQHQLYLDKGSVIIWHPLLPHSGSPIIDLNRTRHSVVMHTIPKDTSVYHGDVFFNPDARVQEKHWLYLTVDGRLVIEHGGVQFG